MVRVPSILGLVGVSFGKQKLVPSSILPTLGFSQPHPVRHRGGISPSPRARAYRPVPPLCPVDSATSARPAWAGVRSSSTR